MKQVGHAYFVRKLSGPNYLFIAKFYQIKHEAMSAVAWIVGAPIHAVADATRKPYSPFT